MEPVRGPADVERVPVRHDPREGRSHGRRAHVLRGVPEVPLVPPLLPAAPTASSVRAKPCNPRPFQLPPQELGAEHPVEDRGGRVLEMPNHPRVFRRRPSGKIEEVVVVPIRLWVPNAMSLNVPPAAEDCAVHIVGGEMELFSGLSHVSVKAAVAVVNRLSSIARPVDQVAPRERKHRHGNHSKSAVVDQKLPRDLDINVFFQEKTVEAVRSVKFMRRSLCRLIEIGPCSTVHVNCLTSASYPGINGQFEKEAFFKELCATCNASNFDGSVPFATIFLVFLFFPLPLLQICPCFLFHVL
mmetsp:Transcript_12199/g.30009  ORF Transcript_12199/g.30009 Transcript_12199/m.30009 type:complete len:299 (-) Transcript_12199:1194-2090(-)